jgi:hypothetical protein
MDLKVLLREVQWGLLAGRPDVSLLLTSISATTSLYNKSTQLPYLILIAPSNTLITVLAKGESKSPSQEKSSIAS